jgi:hypothetical protein
MSFDQSSEQIAEGYLRMIRHLKDPQLRRRALEEIMGRVSDPAISAPIRAEYLKLKPLGDRNARSS